MSVHPHHFIEILFIINTFISIRNYKQDLKKTTLLNTLLETFN